MEFCRVQRPLLPAETSNRDREKLLGVHTPFPCPAIDPDPTYGNPMILVVAVCPIARLYTTSPSPPLPLHHVPTVFPPSPILVPHRAPCLILTALSTPFFNPAPCPAMPHTGQLWKVLPAAEKAKYEAGLRKLPCSGRGGMRVWVQDPGGPGRAHPPLSAMPPSASTAPPVPSRAPAASASRWPERLTPSPPQTSVTAVEVPAEGCVASETSPASERSLATTSSYAWSKQPSWSSHPSCSSDDSEPEPVDTATHAPPATRAAPFGAPTAPPATPTAPPAEPASQLAPPAPLPAPSDSPLRWTLQSVQDALLHATRTRPPALGSEVSPAESEIDAVLTDLLADEAMALELQSILDSRGPELQGAADSATSDATPPDTPARPDPEWLTELFDKLVDEDGADAGSECQDPHLPVGSPAIRNHGQDTVAPRRTARPQDACAGYNGRRTTAEGEATRPSVKPEVQPGPGMHALGMQAGYGHPPANLGHGMSNVTTPEQQAISTALDLLHAARTDIEVCKLTRTLAFALGATRAEVGTTNALHAVLLQMTRPGMRDIEAFTFTKASKSNFEKWKRKVFVHMHAVQFR